MLSEVICAVTEYTSNLLSLSYQSLCNVSSAMNLWNTADSVWHLVATLLLLDSSLSHSRTLCVSFWFNSICICEELGRSVWKCVLTCFIIVLFFSFVLVRFVQSRHCRSLCETVTFYFVNLGDSWKCCGVYLKTIWIQTDVNKKEMHIKMEVE